VKTKRQIKTNHKIKPPRTQSKHTQEEKEEEEEDTSSSSGGGGSRQ
tara:strand:- start:825 stop:962 length:138 start_codon:yes stop_codon:yes gene_type:complete